MNGARARAWRNVAIHCEIGTVTNDFFFRPVQYSESKFFTWRIDVDHTIDTPKKLIAMGDGGESQSNDDISEFFRKAKIYTMTRPKLFAPIPCDNRGLCTCQYVNLKLLLTQNRNHHIVLHHFH